MKKKFFIKVSKLDGSRNFLVKAFGMVFLRQFGRGEGMRHHPIPCSDVCFWKSVRKGTSASFMLFFRKVC